MRKTLLALALVTIAGAAHAQDEQIPHERPSKPSLDDEPPPLPRTETVSYAWQTLALDGVALTSFLLAFAREKDADDYLLASLTIYGLGAPIVHWGHGHGGRGFGSAAIRAALPMGGALLTCTVGRNSQSGGCGWPGVVLGGIGAAIIDAVRAKDTVTVTPTVSLDRHHAVFGLAAAF